MFCYQSKDRLWHIERKGYHTYCIAVEHSGITYDFKNQQGFNSGYIEDFDLPPDVYQIFIDWIRSGFPENPVSVVPVRDIHLPWGMYGDKTHSDINAPWPIGDEKWLHKHPQGGAS